MEAGSKYQVGGEGSVLTYPREGPPVQIRVGDTLKLKSPELKAFWGETVPDGGSGAYYLVEVTGGRETGRKCLINRRHFDSGALKLIPYSGVEL